MSDFQCEVVRVQIEPHPNADMIEIALVGGYRSIVKRGQFQTGDLAIYIPEAAVVPEWLLKEIGLWDEERGKGKLSKSAGNVVKAIKLRGIVSQGLLYPVLPISNTTGTVFESGFGIHLPVTEGDDVSNALGIIKYEPPIPIQMAGKLAKGNYYSHTLKYNFENVKKRQHLIKEDEEVVMTEKIHGTFCVICFLPKDIVEKESYPSDVLISSKGLFGNGYVLDQSDENNLYVKTIKEIGIVERVKKATANMPLTSANYMMGEIYGEDVQDLHYGAKKPQFRLFDLAFKNAEGQIENCDQSVVESVAKLLNIEHAPVLYRGPFSHEIMLLYTDGEETVSGKGLHVREGVVVRPAKERNDPRYGRVIVKSVSNDYLLRKNGTEYN